MKTLIVIAGICGMAGTAAAHKPSDAHLTLVQEQERISGHLDIAVRDLDVALAIDDGDGALTWRELRASAPRIATYITQHLAISAGDAPCPLTLGSAALIDLSDGTYWSQPLSVRCTSTPRAVRLTYALLFDVDAQHRGLVHIGTHVLIARDDSPLQIELEASSAALTFIREGVWHIWIGADHVLFLVCLLLPAVCPRRDGMLHPVGSLREVGVDILRVVTAFTLAHSLTLALAALEIVALPSRLVETAIALSVVAAAVNNLVRVIDARWAVAFALGLLHGFGFSSVLIDLGLPPHQLVTALLGFNVGVELGQFAIVAVLLPTLYLLRRSVAYQVLLVGGSAVAAAIGLLWAYQRLTL
ncbi:MAG: HupE/UreJ family protein [Deltaproteobacteria bacterium]|nr:HupE/UreJ family protein [Deltaproteobacteria bacterium]